MRPAFTFSFGSFARLLAVALLCLLPVQLHAVPSAATTDLNAPATAPLPATTPAEEQPGWFTDLESALNMARQQYRPVLLHFYSPDCPYCTRMKEDSFANPEVIQALEKFIQLRINVLDDPRTAFTFRSRGVPDNIILTHDGSPVSRISGFVPGDTFLKFLNSSLKLDPLSGPSVSTDVQTLIVLANQTTLEPGDWRTLLGAFGKKGARSRLIGILKYRKPLPKADLVALLNDSRLCVRLGALDLLETCSSLSFGFDPWLSPESVVSNQQALAQWQAWAEGKDSPDEKATGPITLTLDELGNLLQDIILDDHNKSIRARQILLQGGKPATGLLLRYRSENPGLQEATHRAIRELVYASMLGGSEREKQRMAHDLVYGNLDTRVATLTQLRKQRNRAAPIFVDFLNEPNSLLREVAIESLLDKNGRHLETSLEIIRRHLQVERDPDVLHAAVRNLGHHKTHASREILTSMLNHPEEDIVVSALQSLMQVKPTNTDKIVACLKDKRWRVRATALEAVKKLNISNAYRNVETLIEDNDEFVRFAAVDALSSLSFFGSMGKLRELFFKSDDYKPSVVAAYVRLDKSIPNDFGDELRKLDPDVVISVIDAMEDCKPYDLARIEEFATNPNKDVAASALRLIASTPTRQARHIRLLADSLYNDDESLHYAVLRHLNLKGPSHGSKKVPPLTPKQAAPLLEAIEHLFHHTGQEDIKFLCALGLLDNGVSTPLKYIHANFDKLTRDRKYYLLRSLSPQVTREARPILRKLWNDSSRSIRTSVVYNILDNNQADLTHEMLHAAASPDEALTFAEIIRYNVQLKRTLKKTNKLKETRQLLSTWLEEKKDAPTLCGIVELSRALHDENDPIPPAVYTLANHSDPYVRRAALWYISRHRKEAFKKLIANIAVDTSEHVRVLVPYHLHNGSFDFSRMLGPKNIVDGYHHTYNHFYGHKEVPEETFEILRTLTRDTSLTVRMEAYLSLLTHGKPFDIEDFFKTVAEIPDQRGIGEDIGNALIVNNSYRNYGAEYAELAGFLGSVRSHKKEVSAATRHFAQFAKTKSVEPSVENPATVTEMEVRVESGKSDASLTTPGQETVKLVFFYSPGCSDCELASQWLEQLQEAFPAMEVEAHNVRKVAAMRFNQALCERFEVPGDLHLVAPALFARGGYLIKGDISFERIGELVTRSTHMDSDDSQLVFDEQELAKSGEQIEQRYETISLGVIVLAGLLDGVNPCAFATIIFFLSYLQVARRKPWEILQVGAAFIVAVFITYFLLGLGLVEVIARISALRWAGHIMHWSMGVLALVVMGLCLRDGVLCLQGRLKDTTLQLPGFAKQTINAVIRKGARHSYFVIASFVTGAVISLLELACTGQVYAPTLLYMYQTGENAGGALFYLLWYNLAFVAPLVVIFTLAFFGMRHERLQEFQKRHTALIKFALAGLFLLLALFLLFGRSLHA